MLDALFQLFREIFFFAAYVNNTNSFPERLTPGEEKDCLARCAKGDEEARSMLIEHNLRLVVHIAKKFSCNGRNNDDIISIGTIGLIKAVSTYDMHKGTALATYAARCIENAILSLRDYHQTFVDSHDTLTDNWNTLAKIAGQFYIMVRTTGEKALYAPLYIHSFYLIQPHFLAEADRVNESSLANMDTNGSKASLFQNKKCSSPKVMWRNIWVLIVQRTAIWRKPKGLITRLSGFPGYHCFMELNQLICWMNMVLSFTTGKVSQIRAFRD